MKVAIQGALGSFHHLAAQKWFTRDVEVICCEAFSGVFKAVQRDEASHGLIAIENSLYGAINEVYDLLLQHQYPIIGELPEHIHQQLIGFAGTPLSQVTRIYSMFPALGQCKDFLDQHVPDAERIEFYDTAASVAHIKQLGDPHAGAIASHAAASLHGMDILAENIEDESNNFTRFIIISNDTKSVTEANKASLVLRTNHSPGALHSALGVFAKQGINLTKLQSRPIRGKVWKYQFFIDIEADIHQLARSLSELEAQQCEVVVLGHYQAAPEIEVG